jgi:hypothetical protein
MRHQRVLVLLLLLGAAGACGSESSSSTGTTSDDRATISTSTTVAQPSVSAASCVSEYSPDTLQERAFAFDGTVIERRAEHDPKAPVEDGGGDIVTTRALFEVHEWFAGGSGQTALVWMMRDVAVGERLLVTGEPRWGGDPLDDAIAWECGFTAAQSGALAGEWRAALSP